MVFSHTLGDSRHTRDMFKCHEKCILHNMKRQNTSVNRCRLINTETESNRQTGPKKHKLCLQFDAVTQTSVLKVVLYFDCFSKDWSDIMSHSKGLTSPTWTLPQNTWQLSSLSLPWEQCKQLFILWEMSCYLVYIQRHLSAGNINSATLCYPLN